jgi:hypothetical protein
LVIDQGATDKVFGPIRQGHFRLFSGSLAHFYADLLEFLDQGIFGFSAEPVRKKQAQNEIKEFLENRAWKERFESENDETSGGGPAHVQAYARLVSCGWLIEVRDGLRTVVDIDSDARLLLNALLDIKSGKIRSFGGEVLQVKTLLDAAIRDPDNSAQTIQAAGNQARRFLTNLKAISGALRRIEQDMRQTRTIEAMMDSFFDSLVSENLVQDYRNLRSRNNPFRFRHDLVVAAEKLSSDSILLGVLSESLVREGRAPNEAAALQMIQDDLSVIIQVFVMVDDHLDLIERTNARIERRIRNIIHFLDRMGDDQTGVFIDASRGLGRNGKKSETELPVSIGLLNKPAPIDAASLYRARAKPRPTEPTVARRKVPDPALVAYEMAKEAYSERVRVTPAKVRTFLDAQMGARSCIAGSEMRIETLDDFFVFERLPEIRTRFPNDLSEVRVERIDAGVIDNQWIRCADFRVYRETDGGQT